MICLLVCLGDNVLSICYVPGTEQNILGEKNLNSFNAPNKCRKLDIITLLSPSLVLYFLPACKCVFPGYLMISFCIISPRATFIPVLLTVNCVAVA